MARISTQNVVAALKKGTTWGTEVVVSTGVYLYASQISISGGQADFLPRDTGLGGKRTSQARLQADFNVTITCDLTYGQGWLALFSSLMGTESTPAEQTVGQGDYLDNIDLADTSAIFWSLAYSIETDRVIAIPSLQVQSATFTQALNGAGTVSFNCIAHSVVVSSTSTVANITSNTQYPYETAILGGTNHYFRINADSGSSLAAGDNKQILDYSLTINRPYSTRFGLNGASSKYTLQPDQIGYLDGTLQVTVNELDDASYDMLTHWSGAGYYKAELFLDGSQIGTGVNRSLKFQMPYLQATGEFPPGHDVANNSSIFSPKITYRLLKRSTAPTGMTGVTDLLRLAEIHPTRSTKWTA